MGANETLHTAPRRYTMNTMNATQEQIQFRLDWLDQIDDFGMTQEQLNQVMADDLTRWIAYCDTHNWNAEAIDMAIGYC
jgi:hypothetical protein